MRRILDIGHNDLRIFFKRKSAFVWLFAIPTAFVYFLGFASHGPGDPSNRLAPVTIENRDTNFLSRIFLDEMTAQGLKVDSATNAPPNVRVPADFTARLLRSERTQVEYKNSSDQADGALLQLRLVRALIAVNSDLFAEASRHGSLSNLTEARLRQIMDEPNPVTLDAHFAGRKPVPSGFNFSLPGNLVMYLMMNVLIFGGATLAAGRRNGILKRLAFSPATRLEIVMGKIYGNTLLGGAQIVYFLLIGKFLFHVNLGANLPGVILILLALAWAAGALGVLIGSIASSEDRVVPICVLASLLMGALGGCWWPLEMAPPAFQTIAHCLPTGWALTGLHQLISFGSGLSAAVFPLTALLAFGAAANLLAMRFFRT
ncbi:MAG TPA: ABC transporter permease [Verrucomicrobiae bacterium]|jgi:ABC-type multidrug transport system permease subunit|nr:ABC transporter permease [Verrucomicrobiae bacterium]